MFSYRVNSTPTKKNRGREAAQGGGGGGCRPLFVRFIYCKTGGNGNSGYA